MRGSALPLAVAAAALLSLPTALTGQPRTACSLEPRVGQTLALGELAEHVERGPSFGVGFSCELASRFVVRARWESSFLNWNPPLVPGDREWVGPEVDLARFLGTVSWMVASSRGGSVSLGGVAGWTEVTSVDYTVLLGGGPGRLDLLDSSPTVGLEARGEARPSDRVGLFLELRWLVMLDLSPDPGPSGTSLEGFDDVPLLPLAVGVSVGL